MENKNEKSSSVALTGLSWVLVMPDHQLAFATAECLAGIPKDVDHRIMDRVRVRGLVLQEEADVFADQADFVAWVLKKYPSPKVPKEAAAGRGVLEIKSVEEKK